MQLAIPHAPRPAALRQVPGAVRRVTTVAIVCGVAVLMTAILTRVAVRWLTDDARFVAGAQSIKGTVVKVDASAASTASALPVSVIYRFGERQHSATIEVNTSLAEGLGKGAALELLVDASTPDRPREKQTAEGRAERWSVVLPVIGVALVAGLLVLVRELRRALRRELEPLRTGLLVWLTPNAPLSEASGPFSFPAHYFRDDVRQEVVARADGRRRPVRNGEKLLAAVAPREPTWVRVVDEEVAKNLGWYR